MATRRTAADRADILRQAAEIVGAYDPRLDHTPWDMCTCGHRRRRHMRAVGCTDPTYCYPHDACKRFDRAPDWLGPDRGDLVAWLGRLADLHQQNADAREVA